ncbi:AraC family transcriptional regulator [Acinetobacter calcoaceticus]|uniref:AraC family transcriptional regulator n=1 Tax=Acinetobacter calcoaceticus TaxID=471 RepID=A0A4R1XV45_ACICA|nr:AraC family transcriptional regulator [Acinetobacter calcoaceticus]
MDALSKILEDIRLNKAEYLYLNTQGEWAFRIQQQQAVLAYIVLSGEMYIHLEHNQTLHAKTGDIVMLASGQAHRCSHLEHQQQLIETVDITAMFDGLQQDVVYLGAAATQHHLIMAIRCNIDTIMAKPLLNALPSYIHLQNLFSQRAPEWLKIGLSFLALETQQILPGRDKIIDHLISILFIECVRDYIIHIEDANNWLSVLSHPQLSNALTAIHTQPEFAWTVESLAEQCCMSRSKFASVFHERVGETPLAYLQQHRLNLACQLLREGQLSIKQIAHQVGYSSDTTFSQSFKKRFELSPNLYRKQFVAVDAQAHDDSDNN